MEYTNFAGRFRQVWIESKLPKTQKELAKKIGCSQAMVNFWVNAEKLPSMDSAIKLSELFECSLDWLLTGRGSIRPNIEIADPLYNKFQNLLPEQRGAIELMINALNIAQKTQETENNPLTTETENVGGGG